MTKIEWATLGLGKGETWNPIRARNTATGAKGHHCEKVSPGCDHCYAERQNKRGIGTSLPYKPGHRQNGDVEVYLDEAALLAPFRWKAPRGVFVCSMTDLFAYFVTDDMRDRIFAVMALASHLRFAVLTKRAGRMRKYMATPDRKRMIAERVLCISDAMARQIGCAGRINLDHFSACFAGNGPFRNIWLGVTAEDQPRADERIPELLATPAAVRFVSYEPALGPVDWKRWLATKRPAKRPNGEAFLEPHFYMTRCEHCGWTGSSELCGEDSFGDDSDVYCPSCHKSIRGDEMPGLDWVICGGESGPGARPMHPDWARALRDQCAAAGVPFFFKQWGEFSPHEIREGGEIVPPMPTFGSVKNFYRWRDGGFVPVDDREDCKTAFAPGQITLRVGKSRAGRLLDGREWNEFPGGPA
jgi:protein gp37